MINTQGDKLVTSVWFSGTVTTYGNVTLSSKVTCTITCINLKKLSCKERGTCSFSLAPLLLCLWYQINQVYFSHNELFKVYCVHSKRAWPLMNEAKREDSNCHGQSRGINFQHWGLNSIACFLFDVSSDTFFNIVCVSTDLFWCFYVFLSGFSLLGWVFKFSA